ncbi:MAG: penicillin-binding transpeptidase domain-containing protein [Pseudomonadota bacterium]
MTLISAPGPVLRASLLLALSLTRARAVLLGTAALLILACVACMDAGAKPVVAPLVAAAPVEAIDARLQAITDDEARCVRAEWGAERVAILVLDPRTGLLLASSDNAPGQPIVPASTLKPLIVAMALDADLITPEQRFDCGNGTRNYGSLVLRDAGQYGSLDAGEILAVSSNIGASRIFDLLGGERLGDGLRRFHVGAPSVIPSGTMKGAIIAMGEGSTTTPFALASAYGVFANDGLLASPGSAQPERVIKASTAKTLRAMLEGAVSGERATGKAAAVAGARVGGKNGLERSGLLRAGQRHVRELRRHRTDRRAPLGHLRWRRQTEQRRLRRHDRSSRVQPRRDARAGTLSGFERMPLAQPAAATR